VRGTITDELLEETFATLETLLDRRQRFCHIFEPRGVRGIELEHLKRLAGFQKLHKDALHDQVHAAAYVVTSPMLRGATRVLFTFYRPSYPVRIVRTVEEAEAFLEEHLANLRT
jgi:hypothetical protein